MKYVAVFLDVALLREAAHLTLRLIQFLVLRVPGTKPLHPAIKVMRRYRQSPSHFPDRIAEVGEVAVPPRP
jgi:hypothetical protein